MYKCKKLGKYVFFGGWECHLCQTRLEQTTNKITNEISENSSVFEIDRDLGTLLSEKHYILVYTKNIAKRQTKYENTANEGCHGVLGTGKTIGKDT